MKKGGHTKNTSYDRTIEMVTVQKQHASANTCFILSSLMRSNDLKGATQGRIKKNNWGVIKNSTKKGGMKMIFTYGISARCKQFYISNERN